MKSNLDALAATGIPIYLTEMDIDGATNQAQLKEMQRVFTVFWEHPGVKGITMWGFRPGMWRTDYGAYLVTPAGQDRPALTWMKAYVNDTLVNAASMEIVIPNVTADTIVKGTTVNLLADIQPENTTIKNVTWTAAPTSLATIDANGKLTANAKGRIKVTATTWDGSGVTVSKIITIAETTGLTERIRAERIQVFPNPVSEGNFTISGIEGIKQIELLDLTGKKITGFRNLNQSSLSVDVDAPRGVYILNLSDGKQSFRKKIIIR
jgi:hypothetical protein